MGTRMVNGQAVPTTAEDEAQRTIDDAAWAAELAARAAAAYREARRREYPPIEDQLDALWKGGAEAAAMKATIEAVKVKHPKPA